MTKKELYDILKERFQEVLKEHQIENDHLSVSCRSLRKKRLEKQNGPIIRSLPEKM